MYLGHSKMNYLRCPSDPDDDRRRGGEAGFNQTGIFIKAQSKIFMNDILRMFNYTQTVQGNR